MTKEKQLFNIHRTYTKGQLRKAVNLINEYTLYDFWHDFKVYLENIYHDKEKEFEIFGDLTIGYHRISNR